MSRLAYLLGIVLIAGACGPSGTSMRRRDAGDGTGGTGGTAGMGEAGTGGRDAGRESSVDQPAPLPEDAAAPADMRPPPDAAMPVPDAPGMEVRPPDMAQTPDAEASPDLPADSMPDLPPDLAVDLPPDLPPDMPAVPDVSSDALDLQTGLVAHWKVDEGMGMVTGDSSGNNNAGTLFNVPVWTAGGFPAAKFANPFSLTLDGIDDHAVMGINAMPAVNGPKTISFWMKYDAVPAIVHCAISLANPALAASVQLGFRNSQIIAWVWGGNTLVAAAAPAPGLWRHVAYTFDGTTHSLYVDGAVPVTSTVLPQIGAVTEARLGTWNPTAVGPEWFKGSLDDIRVYTRALTAAEIAALFAGN